MTDTALAPENALRLDRARTGARHLARPRRLVNLGLRRRRAERPVAWPTRMWAASVYLVAPVIAGIAVASWFTPGQFVAAGDIGPLLREGLAGDVEGLWGYGLTGAGSATAEIARLPELVLYRVAQAVGVGPELGQLAFFWLWLTAASAACIFAARQLVTSRAAHIAVGVLALINPLMAINLPNPLVPAAVCTLALMAGALMRAARGDGSLCLTVLATLPLSYLAINPPTLAVVGVLCAAGLVSAVAVVPTARRRLLLHAAAAVPLAALAHAWWIVPAVIVYANGGGASVAAVTDPEAWSWTHTNNSVGNVATMTAHWGWGMHEYLPFSQDLDRLPFSPLRWALPALALAAPVIAATRARRRFALVAVAVAAGCIVVAKGLHEPAAWLNLELYRRVPGMWLLREPMSKVGPVLLLTYLAGAAIAIDGAAARLRAAPPRRAALGTAAMAAVVAGAVVFGHPVVTGGVAPHNRTPLPSSRVTVPDGWYDLAADLNADPADGKALILPTLPFYQATTTWGFHGAATLPRDLLRRPTLLGLPGGYFADDPVVTGLIDVVAQSTDPARLGRALDALGVSHLVVRTDLSDAQAVRPVASPETLLRRLTDSGVFQPPENYGVAVVYRRAPAGPTVFTGAATITASTPGGTARAVASLPTQVAAVPTGVGMDISMTVFDGDTGRLDTTLRVPDTGTYELSAVPHVGGTAQATRTATGVTIDGLLSLSVDGRMVATSERSELPAPPGGEPVAIAVNGAPTMLGDQPVNVDVPTGARLQVLSADSEPRPVTNWSAVRDCNDVDDNNPSITARLENRVVELSASRHSACVTSAVAVSGPSMLRFDVQVTRGLSARACLWSDTAGTCAWDRTIEPTTEDWQTVADIVEVPPDAQLFLYADADTEPTTTRYRGIELVSLATGPAITAAIHPPAVNIDLAAGEHTLELTQPSGALAGAARVGAPSPVANCNARGADTDLSATVRGDVIRLQADRDAACIYYPIEALLPGITYDVRFDYRTRSARPARWCLWLDGPDLCANEEQILPPSPTWSVHRHRVELPDTTSGVRLFVYADGNTQQHGEPTINEYRHPSIRVAAPITVAVRETSNTPAADGLREPRLVWSDGSGDRQRMRVRGTGTPFLLALPDATDQHWTLDGLPAGATAHPTIIDGYRQGWIISGLDGDATMTAHYGPSSRAGMARWLSIAVLGGLLIPLRLPALRPRRRY